MNRSDSNDSSASSLAFASAAASATADPGSSDASVAATKPSSPRSCDESDSEATEDEVGYLLNLQQRRSIFARFNRVIQPGESVCVSYAWDMARCECKSTHRAAGVPCITVARMEGRDRCLQCDKRWVPPADGDRRKGRAPKPKGAA